MARSRTRDIAGALLTALLAVPFSPVGPLVFASAAPAGRVPIVAVAIHGDIYAVPVDGAAARRLTATGLASSPLLSPDGRRIAYLSAPTISGSPMAHDVWVVPVDGRSDGSSATKITSSEPGVNRGNLAWSPDSRRLAYDAASSVIVSEVATGRSRAVLRLGAPYSTISSPASIAWSPDGRRIAVALPYGDMVGSYTRLLRVAIADLAGGRVSTIADLAGGRVSTIAITFAKGALGRNVPPGSYPTGDGLAWSPGGRSLVVATLAEGAGPPRLTGLWRVAAVGGQARLFVGTPAGVRRAAYPAGTPLGDASHGIFSPDSRHLAIDPATGFWLAAPDGLHGRFINLRLASDCEVAQFTWLAGAAGLAYVAICGRGPVSPIQEQLFVLPFDAAAPRLLYALRDPDTGRLWLDLAPAYRCIGCA